VVSNNIVKINLKSNKIILIDFDNNNQAKIAISQLQTQIDILVNKTPYNIDKQIENFVLSNGGGGLGPQGNIGLTGSQGPQGAAQSNLNEINPDGGTLVINGTMSLFGDLLPGQNGIYNLGSPELQWHSLYVATSSIYIGGVTLSAYGDSLVVNSINLGTVQNPVILKNDEGQIVYGEEPVTKYYATSSTPLQLPDIDQVVTLVTKRNLAYSPMQQIVVYNVAYNGYMVDDYVDDDSVFFTGQVSGYISGTESGYLDVLVDYSSGFGLTNSEGIVPTYSYWNIDISPANYKANTFTINDPIQNGILFSDGSENNLNTSSDITFDGLTFSVNTDIVLGGQTKIQQVVEKISNTTSSSEIEYNFNTSSIWYHNDLSSDFTASISNVPISDSIITFNIVIEQSATAYLPTDVKINGSSYTIYWNAGSLPTGTPDFIDIIGLSILQFNGDIKVLGQVSSYSQP